MKHRKHKLLIALVAVLLGLVAIPMTALASNADAETDRKPRQASTARSRSRPCSRAGTSATPSTRSGGETAWGNPLITEELLQTIKAEGYNSIRLPVTWDEHTGPGPDYTIDPAWLDRVAEVVDWALANDLHVLVNIHHDSWMWTKQLPTDRDDVLAKFNAMWTQIAERFKDYPSELSFESINEPQFPTDEANAGRPHRRRSTSPSTRPSAPPAGTTPTGSWCCRRWVTNSEQPHLDALKATIDALDDPMIAATVHFYGFWPFSVNVAGVTTYDEATQQDLENTFQRVNDTFVDNGIPVIVGEWGVLGYDYTRPASSHSPAVRRAAEVLRGHRVPGPGRAADLDAVGRRLVPQPPHPRMARPAPAVVHGLGLDDAFGHRLVRLDLPREGRDHRGRVAHPQPQRPRVRGPVAGRHRTGRGRRLHRLGRHAHPHRRRAHPPRRRPRLRHQRDDRGPLLGRRAVADPHHHLRHAAALGRVRPADRRYASFAIPTEFNGDQLATMEAKYADGTNAGPHDWTSFKEFWATYRPDYDAGTISLTPDFFNAVRDGEPVTLTFHFWGGGTVDYTITKTGTTVTGTSA